MTALWLISQKYDIPVDDLIEINNLETVNLQIGDKLKIPKKESKENVHCTKRRQSMVDCQR